jgi:CheY-like chemotaxis protein/HPt (histidine-containing phosphotransfer) domain-containing protein
MPGMDGWETITRMKGEGIDSHSSIIVMVTANGREMLAQRSSDEQARLNAFLVKPVTASMLYDAVVEALADGSVHAVKNALEPAPQPLLGMRLLVVEDNIINQQVAQEMLSNEGAQVELADNGQLGVDAVYRATACGLPFDAVLMDIQMPVMDGYGATHLLRQNVDLADLPIIAMTANAMASDRDACLAAGMNAHVGKPFKLGELVELLQKLTSPGTSLKSSAVQPTPLQNPSRIPEPALPSIDTVDMTGALDRLGGNAALYVRVLKSYLTDIAGLPDQLESALSQADWSAAERLLHTLKGLSATVGASYMAAVARQAELTIKAVATPAGVLDAYAIHVLHTNFRAAVAATQAVMGQVAKTCLTSSARQHALAPALSPVSAILADDGQELLRQLRQLLNASDMTALAIFERLQQNATLAQTDEFAKLTRAMAAFDFAQAAEQCSLLLKTG